MKTLKLFLIVVGIGAVAPLQAQNTDSWNDFKKQARNEFFQFRKSAIREYQDFREKACREFSDFLRTSWIPAESQAPVPVPMKPEPPVPPVYEEVPPVPSVVPDNGNAEPVVPEMEPEQQPLPEEVPVPDELPVPEPEEEAPVPVEEVVGQPALPEDLPETLPFVIPEEQELPEKTEHIQLYGSSYTLPVPDKLPEFQGTDAGSIADCWDLVSDGRFHSVVNSLLEAREERHLCDWNYYVLVRSYADRLYPAGSNESTLLQAYLLLQSGMSARLARSSSEVYLLLPSDVDQYNKTYIQIDGRKFYVMNDAGMEERVSLCDFKWPEEREMNLYTALTQTFPSDAPERRELKSAAYPAAAVSLAPNRNLLEFYASYPHCHWTVYADMAMSDEARNSIYPALETAIAGKTDLEAADILLNFVQTSLAYETDQEQFGYERSLFADETLSYPYSDCEDRSILYSVLVRELLGLDVVLLDYPGHIATAVHFNEAVEGDAVVADGVKYIICDPTYINAGVGCAMTAYRDVSPKAYKLRQL